MDRSRSESFMIPFFVFRSRCIAEGGDPYFGLNRSTIRNRTYHGRTTDRSRTNHGPKPYEPRTNHGPKPYEPRTETVRTTDRNQTLTPHFGARVLVQCARACGGFIYYHLLYKCVFASCARVFCLCARVYHSKTLGGVRSCSRQCLLFVFSAHLSHISCTFCVRLAAVPV